jgi:hypothetical protein
MNGDAIKRRISLLEPIRLTLYDPKTQEPIKEYKQRVITFEILISAIQMQEMFEAAPENKRHWWWQRPIIDEKEQIKVLLELVTEFFGHQFTVDQLREGADVSEVMSVVRAITGRAGRIVTENPTRPPLTHK